MKSHNSTSTRCRQPNTSFILNAPSATTALVRGIDTLMLNLASLTKDRAEDSPFLKDHLTPQSREVRLTDARVTGRLPSTFKGMFCSVIPSGHSTLPLGGYHVFEGDGSVASVRVRHNGRASFAFRHIQTEKLIFEKELGHSPVVSIMALKGISGLALILLYKLRQALGAKYSATTANTNIVSIGRRLFALMEQEMPYELRLSNDGNSLDAVAPLSFDSYNGPFSAHPKKHPTNGLTYAINYTPLSMSHDAVVVVLNNNTELVRTIPLRLGRQPMIHDAAITDKYFVVLDLPLLISPREILNREGSLIKVHRDKHARVGLLPVDALSEDEIVWFDVPNCFVFHTLNAYDTDTGVVLHLCEMKNFEVCYDFACEQQEFVRYELDLTTGEATRVVEPLDMSPHFAGATRADMPQVHPSKVGRKAKYGFGLVAENKGDGRLDQLSGLWKYNLESGETQVIKFEEGTNGVAEPLFIPKYNGAVGEDECYAVVFVRDRHFNVSLNVYDAVTMGNEPLARIHAPPGFHIPSGFHSAFFRESELERFCRSESKTLSEVEIRG